MGRRQRSSSGPEHGRRPTARVVLRMSGSSGRRFSDESGFALVLAVGVMLVLAITTTTVISYTKASSRGASLSSSGQSAYALAEAGINNALAVLATARADTTAMSPQPKYAGDEDATVTTYQSGTASWGGNFDSTTGTWTIKSIGRARNPTGPSATSLTRTLWATATIPAPPYSFVSLNSLCDKHTLTVRSSGHLTITNASYVNSCDMGHDAFDVFGTGGTIDAPDIRVVGGWETHAGNGVSVNGTTCPLLSANPPALGTPGSPTAGCPIMGQPVLADPFLYVASPTPGSPACPTNVYGAAVSYSPKQTLQGANINSTQTTIVANGTQIQDGHIIKIDSEAMYVVSGGGTVNLTVQRAVNGTAAASHTKGKEIKRIPITGTKGTAAVPDPCTIPSGTVTLYPGTYYGGVCIGAASGAYCGNKIGGACTTASTATANVTLTPGTYIMAGGGFFVCGSSTLSAPNVLIYNTQDSTNTAGAGAIDQFMLNTTGSVDLGPQDSGPYAGLTIFQDRTLSVTGSSTNCDAKGKDGHSGTAVQQADIALVSMASTGANGALGSVSGTIYSPASRSIFSDFVSGTANLAVMASCILIDGGDSTFDYHNPGLFGVDLSVGHVWG
jgi:hypothetical protein